MNAVASGIAWLGGSFDPVHRGHVAIAQAAMAALKLPELYLLPCHRPPHKQGFGANDEARLRMLSLVCEAHPGLRIDTREMHSERTSYTVQTLRELRETHGLDTPFYFVIGWDSLQNLATWWEWQSLLSLTHLVVAARPRCTGIDDPDVAALFAERHCDIGRLSQRAAGGIARLTAPELPLSSSAIRSTLAADKTHRVPDSELATMLEPAVIRYIREHRLY